MSIISGGEANKNIVNKKLLVKAVFAAEHSGDEM